MGNTRSLIILVTGIIFVALAATGIQVFYVEMMDNYGVTTTDEQINWSVLNTSSYQNLKNTSEELEESFNTSVQQSSITLGGGSFFDTTWNAMKTSVSTIYNSIRISNEMVKGAGNAIPGTPSWLGTGLAAIIGISIVLLIIGWWFNRN